jgi:hypothetical protein
VSGELTDAGPGPHTVLISWGDGTTTRVELAPGDTTFDARHRFLHRSQRGPVTVTVVDGVAAAFTAHTSNELWVIDLFRRRLGREVDAKTLARLSNRLDRCRNQQAARDRMERKVVRSPKYQAQATGHSRTGETPVSQGRSL